jgi:GTPase-associated system helical domain
VTLQTMFLNAITGTTFEDAHDQSLKPASKVLEGHFADSPSTLVNAALAAFLPHQSKHNPHLRQTFHEIEIVMPFVKKKFTDEPIWLDRYVLGMALLNLADRDSGAAAAMYLALKDPFAVVTEASEAEFRGVLLHTWLPAFNTFAARFWAPSSPFAPMAVKAPTVEFPPVSATRLKGELTTAAQGVAFVDVNGAKQELSSTWLKAFGNAAGDAVAAAINDGLKELSQKLPAQLRSASAYHQQIQEILATATRAQRQGQLMWWLQSRYSVARELSYRTLPPLAGALQMTLDFAAFAPALAPAEVDAVLLEALWTTYPDAVDKERTLNEWMAEVISLPEAAEFGVAGKTAAPLLLCDVITSLRSGTHTEAAVLAGVDPEARLTLASFTVWLWHSTQLRST